MVQFQRDDLLKGSLSTNLIRANGAPQVTLDDDVRCEHALHVQGNLTCSGSTPSPYWVAGRVNGINQQILSSKGGNSFTFARKQTGYYRMTWSTPHPDGDNFIVFAQGEGMGSTWNILHNANTTNLANTSRSVMFIVRDSNFTITDGIINFAVVA